MIARSFLLLLLTALAVVPAMGTWCITVEPVCTEDMIQCRYSVSGDIIVWEDYRSGMTEDSSRMSDIYMLDLSSQRPVPQPVCTHEDYQLNPVVSGEIIAWIDLRDRNHEIYIYNLSDPVPDGKPIISGGAHQDLAISGTILVWSEWRNGNWDIFMYDLSTPRTPPQPICDEEHNQTFPAISGNIVVWMDYRNADQDKWNTDIYMVDLSSAHRIPQPVCTAPHYQYSPSVSGNTIVWGDYRNGTISGGNPLWEEIYLYDITDPVPDGEKISSNPFPHMGYPDISGDLIVWRDNSAKDYYLCLYDLSDPDSGIQKHIISPGSFYDPEISGNIVLWLEYPGDIFMGTLWKSNTACPEPAVFTINNFSCQGGTFSPGDTVSASVEICNGGGVDGEVHGLLTFINKNGGGWYEPFNKNLVVPANSCVTLDTSLLWTVPQDAFPGPYEAAFGLYCPWFDGSKGLGYPYGGKGITDAFWISTTSPTQPSPQPAAITINAFSVQGGMYSPGDTVPVSVEICNTGDATETLRAILGLMDSNGMLYKPFNEDVTVPAHSCVTLDTLLLWTVPQDAAEGPYDAIFGVYDTSADPPEAYASDFINGALLVTGSFPASGYGSAYPEQTVNAQQAAESSPTHPAGNMGLLLTGLALLCGALMAIGIGSQRKRR